MLSTLKTYATAIVATVIGVLLVAVRVLTSQNSKLRRRVETSQAHVRHAKNVLNKDKEVDEQADVHLAEVAHEIEEGKHPSELTDANADWLRNDKGGE